MNIRNERPVVSKRMTANMCFCRWGKCVMHRSTVRRHEWGLSTSFQWVYHPFVQRGLDPTPSHNILSRFSRSSLMATPQSTPTSQPRWDPLCFELLNLLRQRMIIAQSHIVAHATMPQKDETGKFSWVKFNPGFHSHLV